MQKIKSIGIFSQLTARESEIAFFILEGKKTNDIASILNVKSNTISTLKKNIYSKIGVENSIQLYKMAIENKVL